MYLFILHAGMVKKMFLNSLFPALFISGAEGSQADTQSISKTEIQLSLIALLKVRNLEFT